MKARVFRGAIRPSLWLGMPFIFGIGWMIISFLALLYAVVISGDNAVALVTSVMTIVFVSLTIFVLVRDITKKDPYRLRQLWIWLMLRLEQGNYGHRKEFVYVPFTPRKQFRRNKIYSE